MRTAADIAKLYWERRKYYSPLHAQMRRIQAIYKGEFVVPLPDMDTADTPYVPNLLAQGIDQMAGRIASVTPNVLFTPAKENRTETRRAKQKGRVIQGWWQNDKVMTKQKYRARNLLAYAWAPSVVYYDKKDKAPCWAVRHPLETFPSIDMIPGKVTPTDCIFAYTRSVGWAKANGYEVSSLFDTNETIREDTKIVLAEYHDADEMHLIAFRPTSVDPVYGSDAYWSAHPGGRAVSLLKVPNPADECTVTVPSRISLEAAGQFDSMVGMYYMQSKLMALEVIAVERGIFPDTYLEGRPGETPDFVAGPFDGRSGEVNIVKGGVIKEMNSQPGYQTTGIVDRLERAQRLTAGVPADFGGESGTNIRTGRRGDAVLSAVIDFPISEAQEVLALALEEENEAAIAWSRAYDGLTPRTIYVGTGNVAQAVTYVAETLFDPEDNEHTVSYPVTGADLNALMIGIGQRIGMGIMSKESGAMLDPFIDNPETEHDRIIAEGLETALVAGIQQQANSGQIPPLVVAKVMQLVRTDKMEIAEALNKVTQDAIDAANANQSPGMQPPTPDQVAGPAAAASLAGGSPSPIPGAAPGQTDLASLLSTLRGPAKTIQPMRGVPQGAQ